MSGVAVVRYALANDSPLLAQVPAARIIGGVLPVGVVLPAISIVSVDGIPRTTVAMTETKRLVTERVQITVMAKDYPKKKTILALVRTALSSVARMMTVNGVQCDSVVLDSVGPDLDDAETSIFTQSRDCIVKWHE